EDDEPLALECADVLHTVQKAPALERLGAFDADPPGLERPDSPRDHHGAGIEAGARGRFDGEPSVLAARETYDLLAEVKLRLERLDLLHQPIDQLLRAADRQRRNVIDGLVRVELRALAAGSGERVDHVGTDAEQSELEHLEKTAGTRPDDDHFRCD